MKEQMTYHVAVQRAERVKHIIEEVGLGQIIKEKYTRFNIGQAGAGFVSLTLVSPLSRMNTRKKLLLCISPRRGSWYLCSVALRKFLLTCVRK